MWLFFYYLILAIKITLISTMNIKCKQPYLHTSRKKMLMIGKKNHKFRNANDRKKNINLGSLYKT